MNPYDTAGTTLEKSRKAHAERVKDFQETIKGNIDRAAEQGFFHVHVNYAEHDRELVGPQTTMLQMAGYNVFAPPSNTSMKIWWKPR